MSLPAPLPAPLTYAKAGVTPGWEHIRVFDLDAGDIVSAVIEVNALEGWLTRALTDEKGRLVRDPVTGSRKFELRRGRFLVLRPRAAP